MMSTQEKEISEDSYGGEVPSRKWMRMHGDHRNASIFDRFEC